MSFNPLISLARNAKRQRMEMQCDPQWVLDLAAERDQLRAELEAFKGQQPVAWRAKCNTGFILELCLPDADDDRATLNWESLYSLPSQQPAAVSVPREQNDVPLYAAINRACGELPDGWSIEVGAERGGAWVTLYNDEMEEVDFPTNNERLDYTVNDAVEFALLSTCPPEVNSR